MKTDELKEKLVQNGVENEKRAKSIINWHEAFGFVSVATLFNFLSMLLGIDFGLIPLLCVIVGVILGKKYVENNVNDTQKLQKTYSLVKKITIALLILVLVASVGYFIYLMKTGA